MFRRPRSSRTLEQEKNIAQTFVKFLEDNNRKEDMFVDDLRQIYQGEFRPLYNTLGMSFSKLLNTLTYHINACQQLQDRVIFGGGEAAALQLLTDDPEEQGDSPDDLCYRRSSLSLRPYYCQTCKKDLGNGEAYRKHIEGVKHRQQYILVTIRKSLKKPELVFDKNGIRVTSDPAGDEHGVIELKVESGKYGQIVLIIENRSEEIITLKDITLLWSVNFFDYSEISSIGPDEGQLYPGCKQRFRIGCKRRREFGYSYVPGVLTFQTEDGKEFHILRFFSVRIVSDLYDDLKQTSEYRPPPRAPEIPRDVKTFGGIPLPRMQRNGLIMEKLDVYEIPLTVKAQVKAQVMKNNQIGEGLCERLKKNLSFDNYKEKFCLLLHLEEFQMQKDIRNYDMKGVVFQQERGDRRFLNLEVPGLAENRPSVLRGDKIYAYEPGILQRRYEGIVHKVQMLDVKLGFDMNEMPYIKGKKFDIQFTFHRLPVQMEHRACERIASVNRQDMRHVLFPTVDSLDRRGEINKEVSFFYDRNLNSEQEQAVQKIVSGSSRPAPYLVFGPPGTGKTVTLVEAIKQVHALIGSSYILACAPENSAADLLAERLLPHVDKGKMFRMYAASRPWDFVPQKLKDARVVNFDPVLHEVYYPSREELVSDYRIIVTTLVTAGRLVSALFPRNHFTHIFIDEAGHATEPECIIPVADLLDPYNPRGGQLVLAGDPKQLGPILRSPITQKYGLETSLLERLMTSCPAYDRGAGGNYNSNLLTKLVNNYRSHRAIIEIPKQLFYENELNECAGDFRNVMIGWEELPNKNFPIIFHPVFGKDEREGSSPSFFNVAEVETIERYLRKLLDDNVRSRGLKHLRPEMIGVISPYKRQVQKIQKMIEKRRFGGEIKVGSVEEFQGQERRIIILSTVRSTKKEYLEMDKNFHLGFLNNPKRFNVAITRAQALLILIGNPDMLCRDENWKTFISYCLANNAAVDAERKEKVEDIADTLKRLNLFSAASSEYDEDSEISQRQLQEHPEWTRHE
ncbi:putative helicase mov-10-B.1 [Stylophora pistillata]|uniref:putative helicase mov-10-B.1 n=1 Tax=Stylophora pistillata TaxID=50429 RepID=UPI000C03E5DC|nr:putative helicase mov-10-B.1 [Stylophora pistillata]